MKVFNLHHGIGKVAFIAFSCLQTTALFAQVSDDGPNVTLNVTPQNIVIGGSVQISGMGYPQPGVPVTIAITPSADARNSTATAPQTTLEVTPTSSGSYSTNFSKTQIAGVYTVTAQLGPKGSPATAQFAVRLLSQSLDEAPAKEKKLDDDITTLTITIVHGLDNLPDSPPKTQLIGRAKALQDQAGKLSGQSAQLAAALKPFDTFIKDHPDAQEQVQPFFDKFNDWGQQEKQVDDQVLKEIEQSKSKLATCDRLDQTIEALKAVSAGLNFAAKPYNIVVNFVTDFAANTASSAVPSSSPNAKFAVSETIKFAKTESEYAAGLSGGPIAAFFVAAGLVTDAITQAEKNTFNKYCQKFQGPFKATMQAQFYAAGHVLEPWWKYTIEIAGILTLRYPNDAGGKSVALTGQFEGGATKFTYDEEVWKNSDLIKLVAGGKVLKRDTAPVAVPPVNYEGSVLEAFSSPTSFYIPVTGQLADGRLSFKMQDARSDFIADYTLGHTFYVVFSVYTLGLPILGHFTLPYKDAHFVLDHYKFDMPVTQTADSLQIQMHDVEARPANGNLADYALDLKACNPACN